MGFAAFNGNIFGALFFPFIIRPHTHSKKVVSCITAKLVITNSENDFFRLFLFRIKRVGLLKKHN